MTTGNIGLGSPKSGPELLDMYYLDLRSALVETAATLDRIEGAPQGDVAMQDPRIAQIRKACEFILADEGERAAAFLRSLSVGEDA